MSRRNLNHPRAAVFGIAVMIGATAIYAEVSEIRSQLEAALAEGNGAVTPPSPALVSQLDGLRSGPVDEVKSLLPLGQRCLASPKPLARAYGIALFMAVTMRPDSASLLEPYIDEIAPHLDDPEPGVRNVTIFVLGSSNPAATPKGLSHLAAHLHTKTNSDEQSRIIAAALLKARPTDAATVRGVLQLVQERPALKVGLIQAIGVYRITTDEAVQLIRDGLADPSADTRRVSVDSVDRFPKEVRSRFADDLQRRLTDPNETSEVRSRAQQVLLK